MMEPVSIARVRTACVINVGGKVKFSDAILMPHQLESNESPEDAG